MWQEVTSGRRCAAQTPPGSAGEVTAAQDAPSGGSPARPGPGGVKNGQKRGVRNLSQHLSRLGELLNTLKNVHARPSRRPPAPREALPARPCRGPKMGPKKGPFLAPKKGGISYQFLSVGGAKKGLFGPPKGGSGDPSGGGPGAPGAPGAPRGRRGRPGRPRAPAPGPPGNFPEVPGPGAGRDPPAGGGLGGCPGGSPGGVPRSRSPPAALDQNLGTRWGILRC